MNVVRNVLFLWGSLSRQYGIIDLWRLNGIDKDYYRLWICGDGDAKVDVIRMAERDNRVKYYGVLDHKEVLVLQNVRQSLLIPEVVLVSTQNILFLQDYGVFGVRDSTIMCHLPAIPEEYDDYLYYITDESVEE